MKVVTKIIANRLKAVMNKLTGDTRSSFILGRQAAEDIFLHRRLYILRGRRKEKRVSRLLKLIWKRPMTELSGVSWRMSFDVLDLMLIL